MCSSDLKLDLVGSTVEGDIGRAIRRHGGAAVIRAIKKLSNPKKGRKAEKDWPKIADIIEADVRSWLKGNDTLQRQSDYAIAQEFARRHPGHNAVSTHKRIERKLKKKLYDRHWYMLMTAATLSLDGPFGEHLRAIEALANLPRENGGHEDWALYRAWILSNIIDYYQRQGEYPAAELTMKEVEDGARSTMHGRLLGIGHGAGR